MIYQLRQTTFFVSRVQRDVMDQILVVGRTHALILLLTAGIFISTSIFIHNSTS